MINASELRIGNKVASGDRIYTATAETISSIDKGLVYVDPIPLTPEILLKVGFEFGVSDNGTYYIDLNGIDQQLEIVLSGKEFYPQLVQAPELSTEDCQIVSLNKIESVHQLQNLYFELTGKELNITF